MSSLPSGAPSSASHARHRAARAGAVMFRWAFGSCSHDHSSRSTSSRSIIAGLLFPVTVVQEPPCSAGLPSIRVSLAGVAQRRTADKLPCVAAFFCRLLPAYAAPLLSVLFAEARLICGGFALPNPGEVELASALGPVTHQSFLLVAQQVVNLMRQHVRLVAKGDFVPVPPQRLRQFVGAGFGLCSAPSPHSQHRVTFIHLRPQRLDLGL